MYMIYRITVNQGLFRSIIGRFTDTWRIGGAKVLDLEFTYWLSEVNK